MTPPLTPRLSPPTADLLDTPDLLHELARGLGSPLNVMLPAQVRENLAAFEAVLARHRLRGAVYYAHKANRSSALVRELAATPARIDVASPAELQHALGAGFAPSRVMTTGPKTPEFVWLALRAGVTINVDSIGELDLVARLAAEHGLGPADVLVRLADFAATGPTVLSRPSRFGVPTERLGDVFALLDRHRATLRLAGFAYHLDTVGIAEKARAFDGCLCATQEAHRRGHSPRVVDIGGGFGVDYLADGAEWDAFTSALAEAVLGRRPAVTWQGAGYGLRNEGGWLRGGLSLYPAHRPLSGPRYLDELLSTTAPTLGVPLGEAVLDSMLELWIEPGRALLDQCGLVLARVLEVRPAGDGAHFVRLDLNARDVSLEEHGVQLDPVLVPARETGPDAGPGGATGGAGGPGEAYLIGNLCLEADFISRRRISFRRLPRPGDLLAFPNTAGYFMDFSADHALAQPVARVVALTRDDAHWTWRLDDGHWPVAAARHVEETS